MQNDQLAQLQQWQSLQALQTLQNQAAVAAPQNLGESYQEAARMPKVSPCSSMPTSLHRASSQCLLHVQRCVLLGSTPAFKLTQD